ncbi:MAG: hypothetical protein KGR98_04475, partial [Verrucomicrobia bacterium]|nr:hypothetical protein [Verrucomicrobiota bacterium]
MKPTKFCLFSWSRFRSFASNPAFALVAGLFFAFHAGAVDVLTQHNDLSRDGANLAETSLTTANVNVADFGKLFNRAVDGQIFAQPLYVQGLTISNQARNVIFVCTEHNTVYAFDADDPSAGTPLWETNLGASVPSTLFSCHDLTPEIGITATPVIDLGSGTLYVEAKSQQVNGGTTNYLHQLHALDIITGAEKFGGPVTVQATAGAITFNNLHQNDRAGLLLLSNVVYLSYSSHCDDTPYNGWMIGYNASTLSQVAVFNVTPSSANGEGAIWACGMAPAADTNGNIYATTGNGAFDASSGGSNYAQCFLKFSTAPGLAVADWFSPWNEATLSAGDRDIGTGGAVLLPGGRVVGLDKSGTMFVLDRNNLGRMSQNGSSDTNVVEEFQATLPADRMGQSPVYWQGPANQFLFLSTANTNTLAYVYTNGLVQTNVLAVSAVKQTGSPGGISLSANGSANGILWVIDANNGGTLRAYDAANMPNELWDSQQDAARDSLGGFAKFCSPTIANGKVYAPGASQLVVYGALSNAPNFGTLVWTAASGADSNWSTALNWTNVTIATNGPPLPVNQVLFTNIAAVASAGAPNNVVDANFTIQSLQYANNALNSSPNYQNTLIASGRALTITNGLIVGTTGDAGSNVVVNAAIFGNSGGGALALNNGIIAVTQGSAKDGPHQAVLDLSGLGYFSANATKIGIGVYQFPAQSGNGGQRSSGVLYLAQTNLISVSSTGVTNGILVGWNDNQGNGNSSGVQNPLDYGSALFLGTSNAVYADAVCVGADKSLGCLLAFNPNDSNPTARFRGVGGGNSRVSYWGIGDASTKNNSNQSASGTNDFTAGAIDALVKTMTIGVTTTGAGAGSNSGNGSGALNLGYGIMDVDNLTNGWSIGTSTNAGTDIGSGVINILGPATLKVNRALALAENTGPGTGVPSGAVTVQGGTLIANTIVAGGGVSAISEQDGVLILTNTAGAPAAPIATLALTNSTLHLNLDGNSISTNLCVASLVAGGLNTISIDSIANVSGPVLFPLIAYNSFAGSAANFVKGALPAGFTASLVDDSAAHRLDLSIAASTNVVPRVASALLSGTNFIAAGSNGLPRGIYYLLTSTNIALPLPL